MAGRAAFLVWLCWGEITGEPLWTLGFIPFPDNYRHISQTVGPRCCAAILSGGAAPIDREQAAPPYPLRRLSLGVGIRLFCPTNSQFVRCRRGCWTQPLPEKLPAAANFCGKTSARFLHTFATGNERQPSHTSGNRADHQRRPSRPRENPPQARLDICFIQSLPGAGRPDRKSVV